MTEEQKAQIAEDKSKCVNKKADASKAGGTLVYYPGASGPVDSLDGQHMNNGAMMGSGMGTMGRPAAYGAAGFLL